MSNHQASWTSAGPAGLVALAVACFVFFALLTGRVEHSAIPIMGLWLIGGFVIQLVTALLELREGNMLGGNVFTFFSAFFMLVTGVEMLFRFWPQCGHRCAYVVSWLVSALLSLFGSQPILPDQKAFPWLSVPWFPPCGLLPSRTWESPVLPGRMQPLPGPDRRLDGYLYLRRHGPYNKFGKVSSLWCPVYKAGTRQPAMGE